MKKMFLAALLALCLTACAVPAADEQPAPAESDASTPAESLPLEEEFTDPGGQQMAIDAYSAIMESFGVGTVPGVPEEEWYPEEFGSAYIGDDNFLYVCLTDTSEEILSRYRAAVPEPRILRFVEVKYSYKDLIDLQYAICEIEGLDFSFLGVDVIENVVNIGIPDLTEEEADRQLIEENLPADIRERFDTLPITFEESPYAMLA